MLYIVTASDMTKYSGDSIRIGALSSGLSRHLDETVNLVFPTRYKDEKPTILSMFNSSRLNLVGIPVRSNITSRVGVVNSLMRIRQYLKTVNFRNSIIQVEHSFTNALPGLKCHVVDVHGLYFEELVHNYPHSLLNIPYKKLMYCIERKGIERAKIVLVPSGLMKKFLVPTFKNNPYSVHVIYNGFLNNLVNASKHKEEEGMIAFAGNITRWACVDKILKAAGRLKSYDVHFYIVGGGSDKPRILRLIKQQHIENVTVTGRVPIREAYEYIARSQILLAPFPKSMALAVACPIKLLEYMAFGKPILSDNVGEIPLLLQKEDAALVSDPLSDEDFIEKLRLLIEDKNVGKKISRNAKRLSKNFTWDKQSARLAEVYRNYLIE